MKTLKTLLATAALLTAPGLAHAEGCNWTKHEQVTMSCAPGTTLDADTGTCVADVTG
ncbi:adenylosuccinate lyase [Jannaschia sp. S6380]|uniref:adenylosuccinate lyase n=1 Tax=Jannaschia sp. S6380 TaxID=2926408 RepID=UPI001FF5C4E8|nr:adenylosuccinate lyase [Jannaschia sp. S6380]MCK0166063.1 adenylosuccinate lyase [Jannaschia sp. S6380]